MRTPRSTKWYDMHMNKKDFGKAKVSSWSPDATKLNSSLKQNQKQIRDRQQGKKQCGKASTYQQKLAKGSKQHK